MRDEKTRGVAPHLAQFLGTLTLEIPEHEFVEASLTLERHEHTIIRVVDDRLSLEDTQSLAQKSLWNAIIGCVLVPVICNFYSMVLGYRVLQAEIPLSKVSRKRLILAIVFNSIAFYFWLTIGLKYFLRQL